MRFRLPPRLAAAVLALCAALAVAGPPPRPGSADAAAPPTTGHFPAVAALAAGAAPATESAPAPTPDGHRTSGAPRAGTAAFATDGHRTTDRPLADDACVTLGTLRTVTRPEQHPDHPAPCGRSGPDLRPPGRARPAAAAPDPSPCAPHGHHDHGRAPPVISGT
ncbi:hypothetical protein ACFW6K_26245 [Streptomyces sp. NPDC058733]|uniref:hypothetical protein n=1 Tax=Streptomyces sp. NPDC058733 TaxID=3346614 RepID=UPI0036BAF84B